MYKIVLTHAASNDFKRLDKKYQKAVAKAINRLSTDPKIGKPLKGKLKGLWKLRFSRYRIIYQIMGNKLLVVVFEVKHRKDIYR
jgi:mRNA interferase RelE/StbE